MSDEMVVDGIAYIPTKRVAQISGYAQDYIGQLCRAGLVDSKRIGGLWYINLDSLYQYKKKADSYIPTAPRNVRVSDKDSLVSFDGRDYLSTSRAAEITGYHKDYVGQLARDRSILSKQIGNRWYVERDAIVGHKKEKDALLAAVQTDSVGLKREQSKPAAHAKSLENHSYSGRPAITTMMNYTSDVGDLMPVLKDREEKAGQDAPMASQLMSVPQMVMPQPIPIRRHMPKSHVRPSERSRRRYLGSHGFSLAAAAVATVVIVMATGFIAIKERAILTKRDGFFGNVAALSAGSLPVLDRIAEALEDFFVPEMVYTRDNSTK